MEKGLQEFGVMAYGLHTTIQYFPLCFEQLLVLDILSFIISLHFVTNPWALKKLSLKKFDNMIFYITFAIDSCGLPAMSCWRESTDGLYLKENGVYCVFLLMY